MTLTPTFAGSVFGAPAYGQKNKLRFAQTWVAGDTWTVPFTSTLTGNFTVGKGNISGQPFSYGIKLRNRMFIGIGSSFAFSANGVPTGWEEQDSGAAVISFLSQYGPQDSVAAFSSLQGRLAVIGKLSTQLWAVDADPAQFSLIQSFDNTGTPAPQSVKNIGDLDVLYLDYSGVRSLRAKEVTLNAYVNDIGTAIDLTIRAALINYDASAACAIVEPTTKQYWLYLNGTIYVLSNYPESKIVAWCTYAPTYIGETVAPDSATYDLDGTVNYTAKLTYGQTYHWTKGANDISFAADTVYTKSATFIANGDTAQAIGTPSAAYTGKLEHIITFVPTKFVVYNGQVYARTAAGKVLQYGGTDNNTYDASQVTVVLPWLDLKEPSRAKQFKGLDAAFKGDWTIRASSNPRAASDNPGIPAGIVIARGSGTSPSTLLDSTFDTGHYQFSGHGTHIQLSMVSGYSATPAKFGKLVVLYDVAEMK